MLWTDALSVIPFTVVALFVLHKINVSRTRRLVDGNSRWLELTNTAGFTAIQFNPALALV
jgi:hypothetical protein